MALPSSPINAHIPLSSADWRPCRGGAEVRMPRTATRRGAVCFVILLVAVDPRPAHGLGLDGRYCRPGEWIPEVDLPAASADPIAFESTEIEGTFGERSRQKWEAIYILWRYDRAGRRWVELGRWSGERAAMLGDVRAAAFRAIRQRSWGIVPSAQEAAERIRKLLDGEMAALDALQRPAVMAIVHALVASWLVGEQDRGFLL